MAKKLLLFLEGVVFGGVSSQVKSSVEDCPVNLVVGTFKVPVEHHVSGDVSVADRIASWKELAALAKVNSVVGEWFVAGSAVHNSPSNDVFRLARANRGAEGLNLTNAVRVLPKSSLSERAEVEESSFFIKV